MKTSFTQVGNDNARRKENDKNKDYCTEYDVTGTDGTTNTTAEDRR